MTKHQWNGEPPPKGSQITGGHIIALLPDNTRVKVSFEIKGGVIIYTKVGKGIE